MDNFVGPDTGAGLYVGEGMEESCVCGYRSPRSSQIQDKVISTGYRSKPMLLD